MKTIAQQFQDVNLQQAIATWLRKSVNDTITKGEINSRLAEPDSNGNTGILDLRSKNIASMDGFEIFNGTNLMLLDLGDNQLTSSLDVSGLTRLIGLDVSENELPSLNVSDLTNLQMLYAFENLLTRIDNISDLTSLLVLAVDNNKLAALDVRDLTNLEELYAYENKLTSLEVSDLRNLHTLSVYDNLLPTIQLTGLTGLQQLDVGYNNLANLNVSGLTNLTVLYAAPLTRDDVLGFDPQQHVNTDL